MANFFVAFPIRSTQDLLPGDLPHSLRALNPSDLHCTIAFLGEMHLARVDSVLEVMQQMHTPAIKIGLNSVRLLPSPEHCTAVCWSFGKGVQTVEAFVQRYREMCWNAAAAEYDTRPPLAHCTFARPQKRLRGDQLQEVIEWTARLETPSFDLELSSIALYTRAAKSDRGLYSIVHEQSL